MKDYTEPRMHTAEHLLNQTMVRMFNCGRAFSSHIEKKKSKCDYHFERDLTVDEQVELEKKVNAAIEANYPVWDEQISRAAAQECYHLGRLPDSAGDTIRIVHIGDYDACPCSGTHAASSIEVEGFRIVSSSYDNGVLRLRFKIGPLQD
jgi:alanyl-tRNA synthetase